MHDHPEFCKTHAKLQKPKGWYRNKSYNAVAKNQRYLNFGSFVVPTLFKNPVEHAIDVFCAGLGLG